MTVEVPEGSLGGYETYESADGTKLTSYFVAPERRPAPAVLMLRGIAGPDSGYTVIADRLARAGYAALVHQWQVRGNDPTDAQLLADIGAALAFLSHRPACDPAKAAIFGYCKGGGQAILAAAQYPVVRAVVAFHGFARRPDGPDPERADPIAVVPTLNVPVLLLHGESDSLSPIAAMRELAAALMARPCPSSLHAYPGADHGFAVSTHKGYQAAAADDSFARAVAFLNEQFGVPT